MPRATTLVRLLCTKLSKKSEKAKKKCRTITAMHFKNNKNK